MDLFKWTKELKSKFPNIVEKFQGNRIDDHTSGGKEVATLPSVNISNKKKAFEISVAVPGLDKNDINLDIIDNCLIISSEKQYENGMEDGYWIRKEYGYASFQRMFQLPDGADPDKVDASLKNGVLKIKIGKRKGSQAQVQSISVN